MNEYETTLNPVLKEIDRLRTAYEQAPKNPEPSEDAFRRLRFLLVAQDRVAVLSRYLEDPTTAALKSRIHELDDDPAKLLAFELEVADRYGYDVKTAIKHIRKADARVKQRGADVQIRSHADLLVELQALHARARRGLGARNTWIGRRPFAARKAAKAIDAGVYAIGTVVADTLHVPAFSLSYTVAMGLLSELRDAIPLDEDSGGQERP